MIDPPLGPVDQVKQRPALDELITLVNCAGCGVQLLGDSMWGMGPAAHQLMGERVHAMKGRINGRPYCRDCYELGDVGLRGNQEGRR